ncbi:unnamed protein product [Allacma fusca]|uniref:F-box domain-containing protein n=1 Tax=Allacma fusca TaxID=39272 RepID=A0A8J2NLN0_9HEXA|nr:unnamed protein product [Allacma fusca]
MGKCSRMIEIKSVITETRCQDAGKDTLENTSIDLLSMPEIIENILRYVSKRELRECRLVNTIWNEEACRLFRKSCPIRLCDRNLAAFERLLRGNAKLRLPNPFRFYKVNIRKLDDRNLTRVLNWNPKAGIVSCSLVVSQTSTNSYYQKKLVSILEKNNSCLDTLIFQMYRGIYLGYTPMEEKFPCLHSLRKIGINCKARGAMIPSESVNFIIDIMNAAPALRELELSCDQEDVLLQIAQIGQCNALESFYSEGLTIRQIDALSTMRLPKLKRLHLKYNDASLQDDFVNPVKFNNLIGNFSDTLEDLSVSWIGSSNRWNSTFPICPRLKSLTLYLYEGSMAAINPNCFPVLESFSLVEYIEYQDSAPIPHHGIQSFSMEDFSGIYLDDEFDMLINYVDKQFPRLTSLKIYMVLNDTSIRTIVTALPLLAKLHLRVGPLVTEEAFTGVPLGINIDELLKEGADLKDIRVLPSLSSMRYLTHLDVSNFPAGPLVTDVAIKHGLGTMPSLEYLSMNWDSSLSVHNIADSLSHLRRLRLSDWHHIHPCSSIFQLKKLMPQLEIPGYSN